MTPINGLLNYQLHKHSHHRTPDLISSHLYKSSPQVHIHGLSTTTFLFHQNLNHYYTQPIPRGIYPQRALELVVFVV